MDLILQATHFTFWKILISYCQISVSCFLIDIDPLFTMFNTYFMFSGRYWSHIQEFQQVITQIDGIVRPRLFHFSKHVGFQLFDISKHITFEQIFCFFLDCLRYPGGSKDQKNWFWESCTRPELPKSWKWRVFGFSHNEIEKLLVQNEEEQFYGASWLFFA